MNIKKLVMRTITWVTSSIVTVAILFIAINVWGGSTIPEAGAFFWRMIKNPTAIGAVAPTSAVTAEAFVRHLPRTGQPRRLIEVGSGTGTITAKIIEKLQPGDTLDLIELEKELVDILHERFGNNPQVRIHHASILEWQIEPTQKYDAMVMSIPFNSLNAELVEAIWLHCRSLLKPNAPVSYISYMGLPHIKQFFLRGDEEADFVAIRQFMAQQFAEFGFDKQEVLANLPPAEVFHLRF